MDLLKYNDMRLKGIFFLGCGVFLMIEAVMSLMGLGVVKIPIYVSLPFAITALIMIVAGISLVFTKKQIK